jgi:hypothetical protein
VPWRSIESPFPWVKTLNRILTAENPADLSGQIMTIASDYGGTGKRSRYRVNVFLCVDLQNSVAWEIARRDVRQRYLADGRRMAYKDLSDRQRAQALVPFLVAAEEIPGLCLVTIVNRDIRHLYLSPGDHLKARDLIQLRSRWKDRDLEEAFRVSHVVACLAGGMSQPGQSIYWISDEDSLFSNSERSEDMGRILSWFSNHYVRHELAEVGLGTTALDEGDRAEEDLAAVADLVAGAISATTSRLSDACGGRIPYAVAVDSPKDFPPKADLIARWFWLGKGPLRRVALLFEREGRKGSIRVSRHRMVSY